MLLNDDTTMKQLRERHKQEIVDFQSACLHTIISGWLPFMWAPGHYSGEVKVCERCDKIMEERGNYRCR
jgi:hypothetical protein